MNVCKQEDDYTWEKAEFNPRWICTLSNGETIYQDDDRPGVKPNSAWIRLGDYVRGNNLSITNMIVRFRSNVKQVNDGPVDGFFFCKSCLGSPGMEIINYFVAGVLKDQILTVRKWKLPELEIEDVQVRNVKESGECLIINPSTRSMT